MIYGRIEREFMAGARPAGLYANDNPLVRVQYSVSTTMYGPKPFSYAHDLRPGLH